MKINKLTCRYFSEKTQLWSVPFRLIKQDQVYSQDNSSVKLHSGA